MLTWLRSLLFVLVAPPAPVVDILRALRFRGRAVVVLDLPALQASSRSGDGLSRLVTVLGLMRRDPMVRAVRLRLRGTVGGWAQLQAVRVALGALQDAGKPVFAELASVGNADLFLASVAQRVFLVPTGEVHAGGLAARMTFLGDALQALGLQVEVIAAGPYKSLGEPLTRAFPSHAHAEATAELVSDLQRQMLSTIAAGRGLSVDAVQSALEAIPLSARRALELGLVDQLAYGDQVAEAIEGALGFEPRGVGYRGYRRWMWLRGLHRRLVGRPRNVAVVHLKGSVVMSAPSGGRGTWIAADQVTSLLEDLRRSDDIQAVVLEVESGGGSGLASDLIWRAVCRLQERLPVLAVFRNVAASGGYYIAAPASEIFVQPGTLTGSIGVVAGKLVTRAALARLQVHSSTVKELESADMVGPDRAFSTQERRRLEQSIQRAYGTFLDRVAAGRKRPRRGVEPHAGGRVWTGLQALDRGLVDHIGGVDQAWRRACVLAGLPPSTDRVGRLDIYFSAGSILQRLVQRYLLGSMAAGPLRSLLHAALGGGGWAWQLLHLVERHPAEPLALELWQVRVE